MDRVRDEHDGEALGSPQVEQLAIELVPSDLVERTERLVHQKQIGRDHQAARDRDAHLHAAGKRARQGLCELVEADQGKCLGDARVALGARHAGQVERQAHVAGDARPRHQGRRLEHEGELAADRLEFAHRSAPQQQPAFARRQQTGHHLQQRALAAARGTEQGDELALFDPQVDRLQRVRAVRIGLFGRQHFDRGRRICGPDERGVRLREIHGRTLMSLTNSVV